jgi:hypothetical protein
MSSAADSSRIGFSSSATSLASANKSSVLIARRLSHIASGARRRRSNRPARQDILVIGA